MEKYIFLDIDGVIATPEFTVNNRWQLNSKKQILLGDILNDTSAKIVLISSRRKDTLKETKDFMHSWGFLFSDKIVGITIRSYQYIKKGIHLSIPRGVEIKQWIDTHIHSDNGKNWSKKELGKDFIYVIIDDNDDMLLEQKDNFIKTEKSIGLTNSDVLQAIRILNNINF